MTDEVKEYKKLVQTHPGRAYLYHVSPVTERGAVSAVSMHFTRPKGYGNPVEIIGISIRNPLDTHNKELAKLVAILHGLNQFKSFMRQS